jgi:hypothetical protein
MADIGTDNSEREFTLTLMESKDDEWNARTYGIGYGLKTPQRWNGPQRCTTTGPAAKPG